jgi:hypothetical protein
MTWLFGFIPPEKCPQIAKHNDVGLCHLYIWLVPVDLGWFGHFNSVEWLTASLQRIGRTHCKGVYMSSHMILGCSLQHQIFEVAVICCHYYTIFIFYLTWSEKK